MRDSWVFSMTIKLKPPLGPVLRVTPAEEDSESHPQFGANRDTIFTLI